MKQRNRQEIQFCPEYQTLTYVAMSRTRFDLLSWSENFKTFLFTLIPGVDTHSCSRASDHSPLKGNNSSRGLRDCGPRSASRAGKATGISGCRETQATEWTLIPNAGHVCRGCASLQTSKERVGSKRGGSRGVAGSLSPPTKCEAFPSLVPFSQAEEASCGDRCRREKPRLEDVFFGLNIKSLQQIILMSLRNQDVLVGGDHWV